MSSALLRLQRPLAYPIALFAIFASACSAGQDPSCACNSPAAYDKDFSATWELFRVQDPGQDTVRPPTFDEARTWHVFPSEEYAGDTVRARVTVEWGGRSGTGYWYHARGSVVQTASLSTPTGFEEYERVFVTPQFAYLADTTILGLVDETNGYIEGYRKVGPP